MKKLKQFSLSIFVLVGMGIFGCNDDEGGSLDGPNVTPPSAQEAGVEETINIDFEVSAPGGIAIVSPTATDGTVTVTNESDVIGQTSATVTISFTSSNLGTVGVTLAVTDAQDPALSSEASVEVIVGFPTMTLEGEITSDMTLTADNIYELASRVTVVSGVTLTIEAGTVIKGLSGAGSSATALLVAQGATLNAMGTVDSPIIMTAANDQILPGQIESPNLDETVNGLWGGLIILGRAPISADAVPAQIEGIPPSDLNGQYGGDLADDNSGTISYVSIRHGGANIGEGNEINGLTLGGVGSGTTIRGIEIVGNQDDGVECFGGTVNISNVLVWAQGDDAYDMDQAYSGTIDNFIYIAGLDSDHGLELDGPEGTADGSFTLSNGSLKGNTDPAGLGGREYVDLRSDVRATIINSYFFGFKDDSDFEFDNNKVSQNYLDGKIILTNLEFNTSHLAEGNLTIAEIFVEKTGDGENLLDIFTHKPLDATIITVDQPTVGADKTRFAGWTWADAAGELDDF